MRSHTVSPAKAQMCRTRHRKPTRKQLKKAAEDLDQAEVEALRLGASVLSEGIRDDRLGGTFDELDVPEEPDALKTPADDGDEAPVPRFLEEDAKLDDAMVVLQREAERRKTILKDAYPFRLDRNRLEYVESKTLVYEFCLAIVNAANLSKKPYDDLPIGFERLAADVVKTFLGPGSKGIRVGWPPRGDRPTRFKQVVDGFHIDTNEWVWQAHPDYPEDPDPRDVKDAGLDFVVLRVFGDKREGHLCILGQCACGKNWPTKLRDTEVGKLERRWIRTISWAPPVRVFTTPHHIADPEMMRKANEEGGLTLDRARLVLVAETCYDFVAMRNELVRLIKLVVPGFSAA